MLPSASTAGPSGHSIPSPSAHSTPLLSRASAPQRHHLTRARAPQPRVSMPWPHAWMLASVASDWCLVLALRWRMKAGVRIQGNSLYGSVFANYMTHLNSSLDLGLISEKRRGHFAYMPRLALRLGRSPRFTRRAGLLGRAPRPRQRSGPPAAPPLGQPISAHGLAAQSPGPPALLTSLLGRRACAGPACCARLWAAHCLRAGGPS